ncbi:crotonase/enoyl-CoA hydratase family protein [Salinifilum ghardaiensis]
MTTEPRVRCTVEDHIAEVRLDRPDKLNALDVDMFHELLRTGREIAAEPAVRAVVLHGGGRGFCAGLDFAEFARMADPSGGEDNRLAAADAEPVGPARALAQQVVWVWAALQVPVIAAVHGVAFGGGLQLALGADIRFATADARLSVMEINWGIIPDMTGTQVLPELVGRDVAKELTFTGREVTGSEADELGLVTRVSTDPLAEARRVAGEIAGRSPDAVRRAKRLLELAGRTDLEEGFAAEQRAIGELVGGANQLEAVSANFAERAPRFSDPERPSDR